MCLAHAIKELDYDLALRLYAKMGEKEKTHATRIRLLLRELDKKNRDYEKLGEKNEKYAEKALMALISHG